MQIFDNNEQLSSIYNKSISLLIGKSFAEKLIGRISLQEEKNSEQAFRRRELLAVEEETNNKKIVEAHGKNHFKEQVMNNFFTKVNKKIDHIFENKENLYNNILFIENSAPSILELLCLKAASIKRIGPLINSLSWLSREILSLVNKPQYRKGADIQVTDPNLALSYVGLDNLKLVMPTFILKHWLPSTTSPFPLLKRKLWNESLSIALASSVIAKEEGLDEFTAFTAGMLSNIGRLAVTRCCIQAYGELHSSELRNAYEKKDKKLHDALIEFESSPKVLFDHLISQSDKLTADLVELMRFDRLQITETMFDLAYTTEFSRMCPIAQVVAKAKVFVAFRSLAKEDLISKEEVKIFMASVNMTPKYISLLKKVI